MRGGSINPIYNDFINFLESKGLEKEKIQEGYYWFDRMIVKAFDKDGNIHKILRVHTDADFNITFKTYKTKDFNMESWQDTVKRHEDRLLELEEKSISTTKELLDKYKGYTPYICHSGGKDSAVLYNVVKQVNPDIPILFNNTSNESADTYKLIKSHDNVRILNPKEGFWQYLKRENFIPSRLARSCCNIYKHNLTLDNLEHDEKYLLFMGMRNQESNTRSNYQTEHRFDYYPENWMCGLAIREWIELDIWLYIMLRNLPINNTYKYGYSRVGCIICPFRNNLEEMLTENYFPNQVAKFAKVQESYFLAHERWIGLNCTLDEFINKGAWKGGQYRPEPNEDVLREFAEYKGLDMDVAKKYFNKTCCECDKNIRQKDVIAMNMKFLGRGINRFYCKKHLKTHLNINNKQWNEYVEQFKQQECNLF